LAEYPRLKVKLGRDEEFDAAAIRDVRKAAPQARLFVDANAGWTRDNAKRLIMVCADLGVEFVEQPLPIGDLDGLRSLNWRSPLTIIADEDVQGLDSLEALAGKVGGINIKLMKCAGIAGAVGLAKRARELGMKVLLGCMIETSVGIAAASHIAEIADWLDLDAPLLTTNDPFEPAIPRPASLRPWQIYVPDSPGLGVVRKGAKEGTLET
jgi:L-alanine-DL-glutamate epimerase-like enolase superfamily enzyme